MIKGGSERMTPGSSVEAQEVRWLLSRGAEAPSPLLKKEAYCGGEIPAARPGERVHRDGCFMRDGSVANSIPNHMVGSASPPGRGLVWIAPAFVEGRAQSRGRELSGSRPRLPLFSN
jgi:hypothetical protein